MSPDDGQVPTKNLFFTIVKKHFKDVKLAEYLCNSDFIDLYFIAYYRCVKRFDPTKNAKFGTYVYKSVINTANKILKKKKDIPFSQLSEDKSDFIFSRTDPSIDEDNRRNEYRHYLLDLMKKSELNDKDVLLLKKAYVFDQTGSDLAREENVTRQAINQRLDRIKNKIRKAAELDECLQSKF